MPMQPSPIADTETLVLPSLRYFIRHLGCAGFNTRFRIEKTGTEKPKFKINSFVWKITGELKTVLRFIGFSVHRLFFGSPDLRFSGCSQCPPLPESSRTIFPTNA